MSYVEFWHGDSKSDEIATKLQNAGLLFIKREDGTIFIKDTDLKTAKKVLYTNEYDYETDSKKFFETMKKIKTYQNFTNESKDEMVKIGWTSSEKKDVKKHGSVESELKKANIEFEKRGQDIFVKKSQAKKAKKVLLYESNLNESVFSVFVANDPDPLDVKKAETEIRSIFRDDRPANEKFISRVQSYLLDIEMNENGVSEKSFRQVDELMKKLDENFKPNTDFRTKLDQMLGDIETAMKCRPQYWAERAYQEIVKA